MKARRGHLTCQHKRPGRAAKVDRQRRARERAAARRPLRIVVKEPKHYQRFDPIRPGRLVMYAEVGAR